MKRDIADHQPSPFSPGYGSKPAVFGGHEAEVDELTTVFDTLDFGENHSVLISGLRGAGKTSMLTVLQDEAAHRGWLVMSDDASRGLMDRITGSTIPGLINRLAPENKATLKSLKAWSFGADWEVTGQRETVPLLRQDLVTLSEILDGRGILITIDEVSGGRIRLRELSRFALEIQHALTAGADIMVVFAGVKVDLDELLKQNHLTFLRRSKELDFRRLDPRATRRVLSETAHLGGRRIATDALDRLVSISQGYPYLIQLAGDYAWRFDPADDVITTDAADHSLSKAIKAVQSRVISRVYDDLSEKDKDFLRAMALDEGRSKMADIVARMGVTDQYAQIYKNRLIDSGYVQRAGHGYVEFSLPYLDQYIRALLGESHWTDATDDGWEGYPAPRM